MAVSSTGQNDGQVQVVSCASGDVLDVVAKEDLVGKDGRTAKKLIAGVLGDVPYTRIRLLSGDGHDVCNDEQMTEAMLTISESRSQVQVCKVGFVEGASSAIHRMPVFLATDVLRDFLEASYDPNVVHDCLGGETLLHYALRHTEPLLGASDAARYLLEAWADPNARSWNGVTPLMAGLMVGFVQPAMMRELIAARADVNAVAFGLRGRTALHLAAAESECVVVSLLLECRADADIKTTDRLEETALDIAVARADPDVLGAFRHPLTAALAELTRVGPKRRRRLS